MADIEIEGDIRLPASLTGSAGVKVTRNGVDYLVTLTPEDLAEILTPTTAGRWVIVWNETDQVSERVALSTLAIDPGLVADISTAVGLAADVDAVEATVAGLVTDVNAVEATVAAQAGAGRRNRIVNPDCSISQQGPITSAALIFYGGADQWVVVLDGTATSTTLTATTGAAGTNAPLNGLAQQATVTKTGGTTVAHVQRIEAANVRDLINQRVTVVAKVYQDTGAPINASLSLATPTATDNFTTTAALASLTPVSVPTATWTTLTFTTAGVLGVEVAKGLQVAVNFATGSVAAKNFYVGEVGLYGGTVAPPFEPLSRDEELSRCQRYWQPMYILLRHYAAAAGATLAVGIPYVVSMRGTPTATLLSTLSGPTNSSGQAVFPLSNGVSASVTATAIGDCSVERVYALISRL